MQVPIISGIYTDSNADFRTSYPVNMVPVSKDTGISAGYLRPAEGAVALAAGPGVPRGGIEWNGVCYRVMGTKLVSVVGAAVTILGDVGAGGRCAFDYSFDRLAVTSGGRLYYWDGGVLTQVVDPDLGTALAVKWVDGYFMTTDGEFLVVTELGNPLSVNPLKYGSSEVDPDPILTVLKVRNQIHAVNRHTIEVFYNAGSDLFPFQRIEGAQMQKGAVGTFAACIFADALAFVGSGKNEPPSVYIGNNGATTRISTREIDVILASYPDLSNIVLESRTSDGHMHLWIRLPDRTLVYDLAASAIVNVPVWFQLTSAQDGFSAYRVVDPIYCKNQWLVVDAQTNTVGVLDKTTARHFGEVVRWEFATGIAYNDGRGAIFSSVELVCLTGRVEPGEDPYISTSYSVDGMLWSQDRPIRAGVPGDRTRRLVWFQQGHMLHWRAQRFRGDSRALISAARLEVNLEPLQ
jgi:hypothetical protein